MIAAIGTAGDVGDVLVVHQPHLKVTSDWIEHDAGVGVAPPTGLVALSDSPNDVENVKGDFNPLVGIGDMTPHQISCKHFSSVFNRPGGKEKPPGRRMICLRSEGEDLDDDG